MLTFTSPLEELVDYPEMKKCLKRLPSSMHLTGCMDSQKMQMLHGLGDGFQKKIIACSDEETAKQVLEEFSFFEEDTYYYPPRDALFHHADVKNHILESDRLRVMHLLLTKERYTIVTTADALLERVPSLKQVRSEALHLREGKTVEGDLAKLLTDMGYDREESVTAPGEFAVRGGIVDIFAMHEEMPIRMELWGDEITSMRYFSSEDQKSLESVKKCAIYPAISATALQEDSFLDWFPQEESLLVLNEPSLLKETMQGVSSEFEESKMRREEMGQEFLSDEELFSVDEIVSKMRAFRVVALSAMDRQMHLFEPDLRIGLDVHSVPSYSQSFSLLVKDLKKYRKEKYRILVVSPSPTRARRLSADLTDLEIPAFYSEDYDRVLEPGQVMVAYGKVHRGYVYPLIKFMVITESDIFGKTRRKKPRRGKRENAITDFSQLTAGDYVVHENHGLGIYRGIEKITSDDITRDYMKIEYAKGDCLYIPVTAFAMIQKYGSADGRRPALNRLGGDKWSRTKSRVKASVAEIAQELVELYALRQEKQGFAYEEDTVWQREFEELFPFDETADQMAAIEETKADMESTKIMDRLILGDVGYGKTEIAIRAAFKAVQDNKQVAYLCPTTILAEQHFNTFQQRMKDYPVRVDLLCRFRSQKEQKKTIADLKSGQVDILIGTHRLLSKDVVFKDLGLLIVDEEQRFGVKHKEKIKQIRQDVDVLTLSATPIPRTLHMSLIGIRDMSVLTEAPEERTAVQTYVMEYDRETVREAIAREMRRGGQVYYVYNRIDRIADIARNIQDLISDASVDYIHGQMNEREIEDRMYAFVHGDIDVLVTTTIIETGLDIPNVNTLIIHDADRFGLAQLYQLRGRVGRSNRTAYAFLLIRQGKVVQEEAQKRLQAIREFTQLGSGLQIALKDLEIRGAGNLLGQAQHGHMEAVGYDLYCKMLAQAVARLKGEEDPTLEYTTTIDLNVNAFIPKEYIAGEIEKLNMYKKISSVRTHEEEESMVEELEDRFGPVPGSVRSLLEVALLREQAHRAGLTDVVQRGKELQFIYYPQADVNPMEIPQIIQEHEGRMKFYTTEPPKFIYFSPIEMTESMILENVKKILNQLGRLLGESEMVYNYVDNV